MYIFIYDQYCIIYTFLYHMKMVSARLKMLILKVDITVSKMTMALMQIKHGCMEIDFILLVMVFLVMK